MEKVGAFGVAEIAFLVPHTTRFKRFDCELISHSSDIRVME